MISVRLFALLAVLPLTPMAHADSISAGAVSSFALGSSADTISLNAGSATVAAPGTFTQTGVFNVGDSGQMNSTVSFSFVDNIIINGISKAVTISGSDLVTPAYDTLTIFATGPLVFGADTWSLRSFSLTAPNIQPYAMTLTADVTPSVTPEPAGLALLGTGALATAFVARRKAFFAVVGS